MKETYWGYWLVLLGVFIIGVMLLVNNITTTNTQDYYNVKEVTQAAMIDSVDFAYYGLYGNLKMSEQKFVENFVRRFSENLNLANTYKIDFYDIYEVPPKVSVKVSTSSNAFNIANTNNNSYDVVTTLSAILELGVPIDGNNNSDKSGGKCGYRITDSLYNLFNGQTVNGYKYDDLIKKESFKNVNVSKYNKYRNMTDKDDFMNKFGQEVLSGNKKYEELDALVKMFVEKGWIIII